MEQVFQTSEATAGRPPGHLEAKGLVLLVVSHIPVRVLEQTLLPVGSASECASALSPHLPQQSPPPPPGPLEFGFYRSTWSSGTDAGLG